MMSSSNKDLTIMLLVTGIAVGLMLGLAISHVQLQNLVEEYEDLKLLHHELQENYTCLQDFLNSSLTEKAYLEDLVVNAGFGNLTLGNITFYYTPPPDGEVNSDAIYEKGELIWVYARLTGFKCIQINNSWHIDVMFQFQVLDHKGNVLEKFKPLKLNATYRKKPKALQYIAWTRLEDPGLYIVIVSAFDKLSLKSTVSSAIVIIK